MSSNLSALNTGISMNFDGQVLQLEQEKEYQKEEEQQENELRALLTNAFDDLMDEDDEFSVTSDEGADSRNQSLHFKTKEENEPIAEEEDHNADSPTEMVFQPTWTRRNFPMPTSTPLGGLPTIAQSPYGSMSSLRQSQESLRASQEILRSSQELLRSSHEGALRGDGVLESDGYHSNSEQGSTTSANQHHHHQFKQTADWANGNPYLQNHGQPNVYGQSHGPEQHIGHSQDTHHQWLPSDHLYGAGQEEHENFQNYRYTDIPERQETEGGNNDDHYLGHYGYHHPHHHQQHFYDDYQEDKPRADNFVPYNSIPHSQTYQSIQTDLGYHTANAGEQLRDDSRAVQHIPQAAQVRGQTQSHNEEEDKVPALSPRLPQDVHGEYKVQYNRKDRSKFDHHLSEDEDRSTSATVEKRPKMEERREPDLISAGESTGDGRQVAQLQVLYNSRGRKLEEMSKDFDMYKQEKEREIRILKHQLSLTKGEREGTSTNLKQCQDLLVDSKTENAQLKGKLQASEAQIEALQKGKEEAIKNLQTAESNIETLNHQLAEMGSSDSLNRARHEHERVVAGIQQKHEKEIKVLKEKIDSLTEKINDLSSENSTLKQKLNESYKEAELSQISRAETINKLTKSLEESQKQCQMLLESSSSHELSQLKVQLKQTMASKKIADDMIVSYQDEIKELKEQLNLFEAARSLGVLSRETTFGTESHDDSMLDLGIKKTLDFETPDTPQAKSSSTLGGERSHELVTGLKRELERCLLSNKEKRIQVAKLQEELRTTKKDLEEFRERCDRSERSFEECKSKLNEWEELVRSEDKVTAIEARLMKDINNLRREKQVLMEDAEELKARLEETAASEEKLSEINQELNLQISQMVKDSDEDKREALERCQRACESVHETARENLKQQMINEFSTEKSNLITKYETECNKLRNELNSTLKELDGVKEMYVQVCAEKSELEEKIKEQLENKMAEKLKQLKEELEERKNSDVMKIKEDIVTSQEEVKVKVRQQLKQEMEEENKREMETKIAMAKVEWFEEQHLSKQAAVDNAVKLTEAEWTIKLETTLEKDVEKKIEEARAEWLKQQEQRFDNKLQQQLQAEQEKWQKQQQQTFDDKLQQQLQAEKEKWQKQQQQNFDDKLQQQLQAEQEKWQKTVDNEYQKKLQRQKELWETDTEAEMKKAIDNERAKTLTRYELDRETALQKEREKWQKKLEVEVHSQIEKEKKNWEEQKEIEILEKVHKEREKWNEKTEKEMKEKLENERQQWEKLSEQQTLERVEVEVEEAIARENERWHVTMETEQVAKVKEALEQAKQEWEDWHDQEIEQMKNSMEEQTKARISSEVHLALDDLRKEYQAEVQSKVSSSEVAQRVLTEEMETLKKDYDQISDMLKEKEEAFRKEKGEMIAQKDAERKKAVQEVQDQCERDYNQLTADHHDTLTQNLKAAREQHTKEKLELEKRYKDELKVYQHKVNQLKEALNSANKQQINTGIEEQLRKEKEFWDREKRKLQEEVEERDALLEKADAHLSHEVERLRSELETAYQRRLDSETDTIRQKFEHEYGRGQRSDREEKLELEYKLEELQQEKEKFRGELKKVTNENRKVIDEIQKVTEESFKVQSQIHKVKEENKHLKEEVQKVKDRMFEETRKYVKEIQELKVKLSDQMEKLSDQAEKLSNQTERISELQAKESDATGMKEEFEKLKQENDVVLQEKQGLIQNLEHIKKELDTVMSEKSQFAENVKNLESAYKKDLASQKQKQEDVNTRLINAEKMLQEAKQVYRAEIEKVRKSLEKDNNITMETMKNKMVEMSKNQSLAMESMRKQYEEEIAEVKQQQCEKDMNNTEVQTDSEDMSDDSMFELRDQYLDTVNKIKDDVMKHITETNLRAAETVRCEMMKERNLTLKQLKKIYMDNVRKVLQNEIIGANIEAKLSDIEDALDAISFDKSGSSSRSTTPRSDISRSMSPTQGQTEHMPTYLSKPHNEYSSGHGTRYANDYQPKSSLSSPRSYYDVNNTSQMSSKSYDVPMVTTNYDSRPRKEKRPRSAGDASSKRMMLHFNEVSRRSHDLSDQNSNDAYMSTSPRDISSADNSYTSPRDRTPTHRGSKEVTFSDDCKKSSPKRMEDRLGERISRTHPNITTRKLSPRDHSSSIEHSDLDYSSPRNFRLGQLNGNDLLPSKYVLPGKDQDQKKFVAVDPRPMERKPKPLKEEIESSGINQNALYKARSEPELNSEQQGDYSNLLGSYKYTPLRENLGKGTYQTSPTKSSISEEDLRFSGMPSPGFNGQKSYSVDVGLHGMGVQQMSPRKFNPSPEKLQHDAGESPMGTPRMRRRYHYGSQPEEVDRVRRDIGQSFSAATIESWKEYSLRTKEPVKTLVQRFQGMTS